MATASSASRRMQSSQCFQRGVIQHLHAERNTIDAGGAIAAKARRFDTGRIGLQRHFDIIGDLPMLADRIENGADRLRLHQRRRAAAEKDRGHLPAWNARSRGLDLAGKG